MVEQAQLSSWEQIRGCIQEKDVQRLMETLDSFPSGELARALTRLNEEDRHQLMILLDPEEAADLLEELSEAQGADIIEDLPVNHAAAIVDEMESDHRADLLGEMADHDIEAILSSMDPEEAKDARFLLEYGEDVAGGVMITEFVSYPVTASVRGVLRDMRENAETYSDIGLQYAYVESDTGTLVGVLRLRDLLLAPAEKSVREIMIVNPIYVLDNTPLEDLDDFFDRYPFWGVPVTNEEGKMLGVVRRADMEEALGEKQEKAFLRYSGIIGGEELRSMPLGERAKRRLLWLSLNVLLSMLAASVILAFEGTINKLFALVFFIPIIGNMCGCTGNQAVAVSIREMALGLIQPSDFLRVWVKEASLGLLNGVVIGAFIGLVALGLNALWFHGAPFLALVIGCAFVLNTLVAVSLGGLIPLFLRMINADPALGAPPILTTLTDMFGLLLVLSLAALSVHFGLV